MDGLLPTFEVIDLIAAIVDSELMAYKRHLGPRERQFLQKFNTPPIKNRQGVWQVIEVFLNMQAASKITPEADNASEP